MNRYILFISALIVSQMIVAQKHKLIELTYAKSDFQFSLIPQHFSLTIFISS